MRKHGLALDNLLSAEVVLADGRLVTASARENDDLFWAIRGGGGNFGVVTSFEFKAHPVGTVLAGIVLHPAAAAHGPCADGVTLKPAPDESDSRRASVPFSRRPFGARAIAWSGDRRPRRRLRGAVEEGEKILRPLREYGPPLADMFQPMPYNEAQRMADFLWPSGLHSYWKSSYLTALSDAAIDVVASISSTVPSPRTVIVLEHNGDSAWDRVAETRPRRSAIGPGRTTSS